VLASQISSLPLNHADVASLTTASGVETLLVRYSASAPAVVRAGRL
jgi:hypothetical protein